MKPKITIGIMMFSVAVIIFLSGCTQKIEAPINPTNNSTHISANKSVDLQTIQSCEKADGCCLADSDCWSTNGGCFTREWFAKENSLALGRGVENERPVSTPYINCTCDSNKCVVHSTLEIYYTFGVNEKNILDTKNELYTKDMVCGPSMNYTMYLNPTYMTQIYDSIIDNNLFSIKDDFTNNCDPSGCMDTEPMTSVTLTITMDNKVKTIKWRSNYVDNNDPELIRLQHVTAIIDSIISQKEKDIRVEEPTCGYM